MHPTMDWMQQRGALISNPHLAPLPYAVRNTEEVGSLTDNDITQANQSKGLFSAIAEASAPLETVLSLATSSILIHIAARYLVLLAPSQSTALCVHHFHHQLANLRYEIRI